MILTTITTIAHERPVPVAIFIGLLYAAALRGRWSWPMVADAVLLGLYLKLPSFGLLAFVLLLLSVRHIPALAREVVVVFGLHEYDGWTIRVLVFALPALRIYASPAPHDARAPLPPVVGPTTALPALAAPPPKLPMLLNEGLRALNTDPTAPHVGVIGPTRLGKTTFVGFLLLYRQSDLVIATPKAAQYDPWFGAEVARPRADVDGGDLDWTEVERAIGAVHQEMLRRNTPGASANPTITLVLDEWPQIAELPGVAKKVVNLLRMGAGCGIRLILMATDINVRGWKMDGSAGVLDNLIFAKVEDGRKWSIGRLDANWRLVAPRRLETGQVLGLTQGASLAGRLWAGLAAGEGAEAAAGGLLGALLGDGGGAAPVGDGGGGGVGVGPIGGAGVRPSVGVGGGMPPDSGVQTQTNKQTEADRRVALYRQWRAAGIKRDQARLIRQGLGEGLDDSEWAEAGKKQQ